jgi:hypothetical protein
MLKTSYQFANRFNKTAIALFLLFVSNIAFGQVMEKSEDKRDKLWGIGTSITYPLAEIYMMQVSYSPWESGDILGGLAYQNWKNDQGRANAYTLLLGYRQYAWKGLHAEMELWPAYNPFQSSVDGKTYTGLELWMSLRIGYRIDFELADSDFFILAQPSIGFGVVRDNPWPEKAKGDGAIFEPQIILGIQL